MALLTLRSALASSVAFSAVACGSVEDAPPDAPVVTPDGSVDAPPSIAPPINAVSAGTVLENATMSLAGLLVSADADTMPGGLTYTVRALPADGSLKLDGAPLAVGGTFTQQAVTDGRVTYVHGGAENLSDSFAWDLSDGTNKIPATGTLPFAITVTPVNDVPLIVNNPVSVVAEGGTEVLTATRLLVSDAETANPLNLTYTFVSITRGTLQKSVGNVFSPMAANATFTQQDIADGLIRFVDSGVDDALLAQQMNTTAAFSWRVDDGAGGVNPSPTTSNNSTFTISSVDDAATVAWKASQCYVINVAANANPLTTLTDVDNPTSQYSICIVSIGGGTSIIPGTTTQLGQTVTIMPTVKNGTTVLAVGSCVVANALSALTLTTSANQTGGTVTWKLMKGGAGGVQVGANATESFPRCL